MNYTIQKFIILTCRNNINFNITRKINTVCTSYYHALTTRVFMTKFSLQLHHNNLLYTTKAQFQKDKSNLKLLTNKDPNNYSSVQMKKRTKKRTAVSTNDEMNTAYNVKALATSEEYNLEALVQGLIEQNLYVPSSIQTSTNSLPDVIHAVAKYEVNHEQREAFFFREGTIVMWNISELECENILEFLKKYEQNRYMECIVKSESEVMCYSYADHGKKNHIKDGNIILALNATNLDKYTFSNAMAQSVKLGIWEASLDHYIDSIAFVTEDLKSGRSLKMTQHEVLKKQGELFALRHSINLSSDLLDTPDFYWERDDLERLYQETCSYFNIAKRTRVINEKLNHCVELVGILAMRLSDRHHIRLEWMIIILIMVEVVFEILHYINRYFS
ncbi:required for meiotic nuclear division protein 1 homolog isoform X3 [Bombus terrestris]|uniref:Required for meiotic nuclear division protein 1 homolog isoform X3 n=1 Tax=Bombus terrestris TaxID=30195 RepID=A0A9B7HVZ2_BOMTE|nr:required for meiotic nuclear division protein 1 homolog isoform X3 [Bombus terrestris]